MKKNKLKVTGVIIREGHIKCLWECDNIGFGELDIYSDKKAPHENSVYKDETRMFEITTECMGEEFYYEVLESMNEYLKKHSFIIG